MEDELETVAYINANDQLEVKVIQPNGLTVAHFVEHEDQKIVDGDFYAMCWVEDFWKARRQAYVEGMSISHIHEHWFTDEQTWMVHNRTVYPKGETYENCEDQLDSCVRERDGCIRLKEVFNNVY